MPLKCPDCENTYNSELGLRAHQESQHGKGKSSEAQADDTDDLSQQEKIGEMQERRTNVVMIPVDPPVFFSILWRGRFLGVVNDMYFGESKTYSDQTLEYYLGDKKTSYSKKERPYDLNVSLNWPDSKCEGNCPVAQKGEDGFWHAFTQSYTSTHVASVQYFTEHVIDLDKNLVLCIDMTNVDLD